MENRDTASSHRLHKHSACAFFVSSARPQHSGSATLFSAGGERVLLRWERKPWPTLSRSRASRSRACPTPSSRPSR
eukprot:3773506-Alexandrium_andersonii.AAC.1